MTDGLYEPVGLVGGGVGLCMLDWMEDRRSTRVHIVDWRLTLHAIWHHSECM